MAPFAKIPRENRENAPLRNGRNTGRPRLPVVYIIQNESNVVTMLKTLKHNKTTTVIGKRTFVVIPVAMSNCCAKTTTDGWNSNDRRSSNCGFTKLLVFGARTKMVGFVA